MKLENVGLVIAKREYVRSDGGGISILIGKPELMPSGVGWDHGDSYYCPFQISGIGEDAPMFAAGIDSIQALKAALDLIGARIESCPPFRDGKISWTAGDRPDDVGGEDFGLSVPTGKSTMRSTQKKKKKIKKPVKRKPRSRKLKKR